MPDNPQGSVKPDLFVRPALQGDVAGVAVMAGQAIHGLLVAVRALNEQNADGFAAGLEQAETGLKRLEVIFDRLSGWDQSEHS